KDNEKFNVFYDAMDFSSDSLITGEYSRLTGEGWDISGIYEYTPKDDDFFKDNVNFVKFLSGFFFVSNNCLTDFEFNTDAETLKINTLYTGGDIYDTEAVIINSFLGVMFPVKYLCVMASEFNGLSSKLGKMPQPESDNETGKTVAKKGELIKCLLRLIDDMGDIDLDNTPVSKIVNILEATAARKGIEMPDTHRQTWQKYLGR
ncbi:TPA: hypothetical protein MAD81_003229, partial [Klebsiella pneumoniae]|nr:hypothetical protein [Klebsiella pneumoniae]